MNIAIISGVLILSLSTAQLALAEERFAIVQEAPTIEHIDSGYSADSSGDVTSFIAEIIHEDGTRGVMHGLLHAVATKQLDGVEVVHKHGQVVIQFGSGDSLIVNGSAIYPSGLVEMSANAPQRRAITGGTGRYVGARGEMTTTRNENGQYDHEILLVD